MKTNLAPWNCIPLLMASISLNGLLPTQAAITGQWDFDTDLSATIGEPIEYLDGPGGNTQQNTQFGTTDDFGIFPVDGEPARVMKFPKTSDGTGGFRVPTGAGPNGGSPLFTLQYTILMDVLFPEESMDKTRALFQVYPDDGGDAEFFVNSGNGLGAPNGNAGALQANTWHRIAFTVDLTAQPAVADLFVDGTKVGTQTLNEGEVRFGLDPVVYLFNDNDGGTEAGYINSLQFRDEKLVEGLIEALGSPSAEGILTGPPPTPFIVSRTPSPEVTRTPRPSDVPPLPEIEIIIRDGETQVDEGSIELRLDGELVNADTSKAGDLTTVTYMPTEFLESLSTHTVSLQFQDNADPANLLGTQWQFSITEYQPLPQEAAAPLGSATTPGFRIRTVQAPADADIRHDILRAIRQLDGTLKDANGNSVPNVAIPGPNADGSYSADTVNFEINGNPFAHFPADAQFPGLSSENTSNFAVEALGFLELQAGFHRFGVNVHVANPDQNDDDSFLFAVGEEPRDVFATTVGRFQRTLLGFANGPNDTVFDFVAPADGIYPFRLVYLQKSSGAALELYSVNTDTGERILINSSLPGAIPSYRESDLLGSPYISQLTPAPGASGVAADELLKITIADDEHAMDPQSVQLTINGNAANPSVNKENRVTTVEILPQAPGSGILTYNIEFEYQDDAVPANLIAHNWSYTVDARQRIQVTGQWDFRQGDLRATIGNDLEYFDGANGSTAGQTEFGTTTSFGIPGINDEPAAVMKAPADSSSNIGYLMRHGIAPNGGGARVNQYTLIMDVYWETSGGGWTSFVNLDDPSNTNDGELFARWNDGGFGQGAGGYEPDDPEVVLQFQTWQRIAVTVDLGADPPLLTKYIDGRKHSDQPNVSGLDGRHSMAELAVLFADNDGERGSAYVSSIQIRNGQLTAVEIAALGRPSASGIPLPTAVRGHWDFANGDLAATIGNNLQYFDGPGGQTDQETEFGSTADFGIDGLGGQSVPVMKTPSGGSSSFGYLMPHGITPNGGGSRVNQYTLIMDVHWYSQGGGWTSLANLDDPSNINDGEVFARWNDGGLGQGAGGYEPDQPSVKVEFESWQRYVLVVDLAADPPRFTKYINGRKHSDQPNPSAIDGRHAMAEMAVLFADNDGERGGAYVAGVQVRDEVLSDAQVFALGKPSADGIPLEIPDVGITAQWDFIDGNLTATLGQPLEYFDGPNGSTASQTEFGSTEDFSLPLINGNSAPVMSIPADPSKNIGYLMPHGIEPNGGGSRVNVYTLIMDVYWQSQGGGWTSFVNLDDPSNTNDGELFARWNDGGFGQGAGGYEPDVQAVVVEFQTWQRYVIGVDLSQDPPVLSKYINGQKHSDQPNVPGLDGRHSMDTRSALFADNDGERGAAYVSSIQVRNRKLTDAEAALLGGPSANGIPVLSGESEEPPLTPEPFHLTQLGLTNGNLEFQFTAQSGFSFVVEYKNSLTDPAWTPMQTVPGDGTIQTLGFPITESPVRFYRVRIE